MVKGYQTLIKKYFEEHSFVEANINSFNNFIENELQVIIDEIGPIIPTIIPPEMQEFKIKLDKIWITEPQVTEADGSKRVILPIEARLRKMTYASPIFLEVSAYVDGVQRETFTTQIGKLPIMVKSKYCVLNKLSSEELIEKGEDPDDYGSYFILNGNERVLITVEDLASNKLFIDASTGPSKFTGRIFSERGSFKIPHVIEQLKDGSLTISFTRFKRVPIISVIKALGLTRDEDIVKLICNEKQYDDIFVNLYNAAQIKTPDDAIEVLAKKIGITQPKEVKVERTLEQLDRFLLPHIGVTKEDRLLKAQNLCKYLKKFLMVSKDKISTEDKDHYMNKRLKLSGDLLGDLLRVNMRILVNDMLYNFQRMVKRGKFTSIKTIIRDQLLTSRIQSAMATGSWVGGRNGISQNMVKDNNLAILSHLRGIVSLLSASQENFEARALHSTHWGKLCPLETPEGPSIGLRKNLAMLCRISTEQEDETKIKKELQALGLKTV
ncbi:DNA-directed RNA polymerase subunit B'' [Candidatus Woesearchaeota archaeon]|nr:DNA-directed RNA polymerase subunit B'' [Candidatus Woesearchaeota archaeon]